MGDKECSACNNERTFVILQITNVRSFLRHVCPARVTAVQLGGTVYHWFIITNTRSLPPLEVSQPQHTLLMTATDWPMDDRPTGTPATWLLQSGASPRPFCWRSEPGIPSAVGLAALDSWAASFGRPTARRPPSPNQSLPNGVGHPQQSARPPDGPRLFGTPPHWRPQWPDGPSPWPRTRSQKEFQSEPCCR